MISVIVPAKEAGKTIRACIQALIKQDGLQLGMDYEVIIVDDGSSDDTASIASTFPVRVIHIEHHGPAAARNAGAKTACGSILAFTDADCVPSPRWLKNLTVKFDDADVMGVKGAYRTDQREQVARFVQLEYEYKYRRMSKLSCIDFIDTYSAAYRKDVFIQNDGFNEIFPVPSIEDQELSFRLARKGCRMIFEPQAVVDHVHDRTISDYLKRKFGIGYWKSVMLHWLPEKALSDSHTAPTQRLEIIILVILLTTIPVSIISPKIAFIIFLSLLVAFLFTISPFLGFIAKQDPAVLWIAIEMLFIRSGALGFGLLIGFLFPPWSVLGNSLNQS